MPRSRDYRFVFLLAFTAAAQAPTASLTGSVTDKSTAAMPGVRVTAEETRTGVAFRAQTNVAGVFNFPSLPPGQYRVSAEAEGFRKSVIEGVAAEVGAKLRLDFELEPGAVSSVVEVSAANDALVNTVATSIGNVVSTTQVMSLPVISRDALGFVYLQAGVVGSNFSGNRIGSLNITIDGINVQDNRINSGVFSTSSASIDIVEEFRVVTSPADVEYGRGSGQIQVRTRSGTNEFHGSVFEQHRNTVLNANTWFNNQRGLGRDGEPISPRNQLVRNNFGGRIGGPIRRNKTFFHANYEGIRSATKSAVTATVLTEPARAGRFRFFPGVRNANAEAAGATVDLNGNPIVPPGAALQTINLFQYDPQRATPDATGTTRRFVDLTPLPNNFRFGDGLNTAGYTWRRSELYGFDLFRFKIDHYFTDKHRMDVSWQREADDNPNGFQAQPLPKALGGSVASWTHFLSVGVDSTLSPRLLNQFRTGFNRPWVRFQSPWELDDSLLPTQGAQRFVPVFASFTNPIADQDPQGRISPVYQFGDTVSLSSGKHTFKAGGELRFVSSNGFNSFSVMPRANMGSGVLPGAPINSIAGIVQNNGLATSILNDLTGTMGTKVQAFNATGGAQPAFVPGEPRQRTWRQREYSWFLKDDWKVRPGLTLNLGVRHEYYGVPYEALGRMAALKGGSGSLFGPSGTDFGALFRPGATGGRLAEVELVGRNSPNGGRTLYPRDWNNFAPAAGFSWQLPWFRTETVFRAGYGIGYERNALRNLDIFAADIPGLRQTNTYRSSTALTLSNMPILAPPGAPLQAVSLNDRAQTMYAWENGLVSPYAQNWNASLTRKLPGGTTLDLRYVGSKGTKLYRSTNINEVNIFENGILDAYRSVQAGGPAPLFDRVFGGLNIAGFGVVDGSPGRTGADALRFLLPGNVSNNDVASVASYLNSNALAGVPGTLLRRAGLPENFVVASPQFGAAYLLGNYSNSSYHAMQTEVTRRMSRGLEFQANWTWARTIGDEEGASQDLINSYRTNRNFKFDKRLLTFHRTHVVRTNAIWQLPFGKSGRWLKGSGGLVDRLVGGWEVSAIFNAFSGSPLGFYSGRTSFNNFSGDNTADASAAIGAHDYRVKVGGNGVQYFDGLTIVADPYRARLTETQRIRTTSSLFAIADAGGNVILRNPEPGTFGNTSDSTFFGPGSFRLDVRAGKRIRLSEGKDLQFYFDAENASNSPQWNNPNTSINSASFGRITGAGGTRIMAVSGRFNF